MGAIQILEEIGQKQGWNDYTKLDLLCVYIDNQQDDDTLRDFLQRQADDENQVLERGYF